MVSCFPLDYMHLTCIGITKRLLSRWSSNKKVETQCAFSLIQKEQIEKQLQTYATHVPSEFNRKLNSGFHNCKFWKATELHQFVLYAGIAILKYILTEPLYINFLHFAVSMRLLLSDGQEINMVHAFRLLKSFFQGSLKIYGKSFVSYNVHCDTSSRSLLEIWYFGAGVVLSV